MTGKEIWNVGETVSGYVYITSFLLAAKAKPTKKCVLHSYTWALSSYLPCPHFKDKGKDHSCRVDMLLSLCDIT